jgi:ribonucleoside-diphosphate reductase beta chain
MEGNATIISLIARDENVHLAIVQNLIKLLPKEDPAFASIQAWDQEDVAEIYTKVMDQEKAWAKYLFKDGSMIGLNEQVLCDAIDWYGHKRANAVGVKLPGKPPSSNPLPWMNKWVSTEHVQKAPQETQLTSYITGGIERNVTTNSFKGFKL